MNKINLNSTFKKNNFDKDLQLSKSLLNSRLYEKWFIHLPKRKF